MGGVVCGSSSVASYTEFQMQEIHSAKPVFDLLGIHRRDQIILHQYFDHGVDNTDGQANVAKLCKALRLPKEHFYTQSFVVFGNQSRSLQNAPVNRWQKAAKATIERCSMSQYVIGLWNLCTLSLPNGLSIWMYRLHFGNEGAHPANILELMDKRYGISENADYRANIDKRWYGADYHKNNVKRTKAMIQKYVNRDTKRVTPAGWIELVKKSPGLLQNHIAARKDLRRRILGERFWRKMDRLKKTREELKNIDAVVRLLETEYPEHLVTEEGRAFFNVEHYNFNAPGGNAIEVKRNLYGDEDMNLEDEVVEHQEVEQPPAAAVVHVDEEVKVKPPRGDAAARALRAADYQKFKLGRVYKCK